MNYLFVIIFMLVAHMPYGQETTLFENEESDSSIYKLMNSVNISKYEGKTIRRFLKNKLFGSYSEHKYIDGGRLGVLNAVVLKYEKNTFVFIKIASFRHVNQVDKTRSWDFNLVRKEKIDSISIFLDPD